jgi:predicted metalloprotease with PDZ domain
MQYQVSLSEPATHLFEVTIQVETRERSLLDFYLPVWTPGSYLVREYARHLQDFSAQGQGEPLQWQKISKNHWQVATQELEQITLSYRVFANELSVRTNHLDLSHGYFNPAALLMYVPDRVREPAQVTIVPPHPDWQVATPLPPVPGQPYTFEAADYDTLVDSPFEVGLHQRYSFEALGKPHEWVIWGQGNVDATQLIVDTRKIIETEAEIFGGLPYDRYLFLLHLCADGYGGLEHKQASSLLFPRFGFRDPNEYQRFLQLVAHEFFHLWNVKRLRPQGLETFDYNQENYTPSLWFCEGATSYYDLLIPYRAGLYSASTFLEAISKDITRLQTTPGRQVQPLSESSFDAWIKLYRRDNHSDNNQISYYLKGELVTLLLDLLIRQRHNNQRSFDDVLRSLWEQFGREEIGYTPEQLQGTIEAIAETPLDDFFQRYIHDTEELPFTDFLQPFGLRLDQIIPKFPYLGMTVKSEQGKSKIKFVAMSSPAQKAGIEPEDELLALEGFRLTAETLDDRLKNYNPGDTIEVTVFHTDELQTYPVTLTAPQPTQYKIIAVENPSVAQSQLLKGWLGKSS